MTGLSGPETLSPAHDLRRFTCDDPVLDDWLRRHALQSQRGGSAVVYVVHREGSVVGFYALSAGSVEPEDVSGRIGKGMPRPIPVILLARMAVDAREQGRGLGAALLQDALIRAEAAAETIGARAVIVHARNERAKAFYERNGFDPSPDDPLHLAILMKDLRKLFRSSGRGTRR